ncbi:ATP-binding protein [Streptomyces sp. B1866]|uniref:ATP-binding protein n=1 Tax=Streptomyces sp. B1866 TaxID=3075431 RepID=UPI002892486F|nr:ATP-binding protein [Streptomyces sp. B1866]MDT3398040.1 ATP-binding protein [Streptomyces sp. B1866]
MTRQPAWPGRTDSRPDTGGAAIEGAVEEERTPAWSRRLRHADLSAVAEVRAGLRELLRHWGQPGRTEVAELLVSELVTNALVHTDHGAVVTATLDGAAAALTGQAAALGGGAPGPHAEAAGRGDRAAGRGDGAAVPGDRSAVLGDGAAALVKGRLRVEVRDFAARHPVPRARDADEGTSGRGLLLVHSLSDAWGVRSYGVGKAVWFELDAGTG